MNLLAFVLIALFSVPAFAQEMQTGWAWAGIASATLGRASTPTPSPLPKPGDKCKPCNGTGKVGDGQVFQTCRDCNGSGKVVGQQVSAMQQRAADAFLADLPADKSQPVQTQECPGGICQPVTQSKNTPYIPVKPTTVRRGWIFKR